MDFEKHLSNTEVEAELLACAILGYYCPVSPTNASKTEFSPIVDPIHTFLNVMPCSKYYSVNLCEVSVYVWHVLMRLP